MQTTEKSKAVAELENGLKSLQKEGLVGRVVALKGLLIVDNDTAKIYTDSSFASWIEVAAKEIKMALPISEHKATIDGEKLIYVEKGTELTYTTISTMVTTAGGVRPFWDCTCTCSGVTS